MKIKFAWLVLGWLLFAHDAAADPTTETTPTIAADHDRLLRKAKVERVIGYTIDGVATALTVASFGLTIGVAVIETGNAFDGAFGSPPCCGQTERRQLQSMTGMLGTAGLLYIAGSILIYRSALNAYRAKKMQLAPFADIHGGGASVQLSF